MTIKLRIISGEDEDFLRDVEISGNATFLDLHNFIQELLNFDDAHMATFFITDNEWHKNNEITLFDMSIDESNKTDIMSDITISKFISEYKQRLLYVFDLFNEKALYIETYEINNLDCNEPKCIKALGDSPKQADINNLLGEGTNPLSSLDNETYSDELLDLLDFQDDIDNDPIISYTDNLEDL